MPKYGTNDNSDALVDVESDRVPLPDTDDNEVGVETVLAKPVDEPLTPRVAVLVKFETRFVEARDEIGTGPTVMMVASDVKFVVDAPSIDPERVGIVIADVEVAGIGDTVIV